MKFEERLKSYQLGLLDDVEKEKLEDEIDKYRAIETFLLNEEQNYDNELFNKRDNLAIDKDEITSGELNFNKKIRKSVNKRFVKMGVSIALILIFIFIFAMYVLPNFADLFYYNPLHHSDDSIYEDIYYDLKAITFLTEPGYESGFVNVKKHGYGKYKIFVFYRNLFTYEEVLSEEAIIKNVRLGTRIKDFYGIDIPISQFYENYDAFLKERYMLGNKTENLAYLEKLSPVAYVASYVTFTEDISLKQLENFQRNYPKLKFSWVNVKTQDDNDTDRLYLGFSPNVNSAYGDKVLFDKFPYFQLNDWHYDQKSITESYPWSLGYAEHFKALLGYVAERGSKIDQIMQNRLTSSKAKEALEYVNTNGIALQGMLIYGEAENLQIYLNDNNNVKDVFIEDVQTAMPNLMYRLN